MSGPCASYDPIVETPWKIPERMKMDCVRVCYRCRWPMDPRDDPERMQSMTSSIYHEVCTRKRREHVPNLKKAIASLPEHWSLKSEIEKLDKLGELIKRDYMEFVKLPQYTWPDRLKDFFAPLPSEGTIVAPVPAKAKVTHIVARDQLQFSTRKALCNWKLLHTDENQTVFPRDADCLDCMYVDKQQSTVAPSPPGPVHCIPVQPTNPDASRYTACGWLVKVERTEEWSYFRDRVTCRMCKESISTPYPAPAASVKDPNVAFCPGCYSPYSKTHPPRWDQLWHFAGCPNLVPDDMTRCTFCDAVYLKQHNGPHFPECKRPLNALVHLQTSPESTACGVKARSWDKVTWANVNCVDCLRFRG